MSSDAVVLFEKRGAVGLVTINRSAARNALNGAVLAALGKTFAEASADPTLRVLVLAGAGGKAFVAGADIAEMRAMTAGEAEAFAARGQGVLDAISAASVPVLAAVGGYALGGGCELAMACDLVLAGPGAVFGQPEVKLGVIPGFGGTQRLVRRVGVSKALDLILSGRLVQADEALAMGLCSRKVEGDVLEAALALASEMAQLGPVALRLAKRAVLDYGDLPLAPALAAERALFALCFATEDQKEGMGAFLEKRPAAFQGR